MIGWTLAGRGGTVGIPAGGVGDYTWAEIWANGREAKNRKGLGEDIVTRRKR